MSFMAAKRAHKTQRTKTLFYGFFLYQFGYKVLDRGDETRRLPFDSIFPSHPPHLPLERSKASLICPYYGPIPKFQYPSRLGAGLGGMTIGTS
jgi:hypothetical protein